MSKPELSKSGDIKRWDKAQRVVLSEGVKQYRSLPSEMALWTVTGRDCEYLVDCTPTKDRKPYCSCDDFYFRVVSEKVPECYHLVAARKAIEEGMYSVVELKDSDFAGFMNNLLNGIFVHIS